MRNRNATPASQRSVHLPFCMIFLTIFSTTKFWDLVPFSHPTISNIFLNSSCKRLDFFLPYDTWTLKYVFYWSRAYLLALSKAALTSPQLPLFSNPLKPSDSLAFPLLSTQQTRVTFLIVLWVRSQVNIIDLEMQFLIQSRGVFPYTL